MFKAFAIVFYILAISSNAEATQENLKLDQLFSGRTVSNGSIAFNAVQLLQQGLSNRDGDIIEFGTSVFVDGKPVANQHSDKDPCASNKLGGFAENAMNVMECVAYDEHQDPVFLKLFLWTIFGVLCGYGTFSPRTKPNRIGFKPRMDKTRTPKKPPNFILDTPTGYAKVPNAQAKRPAQENLE